MIEEPTSPLAERLGARYAIFGFSHDWEVVAAVSQAGGVGVLGTNRYDQATLADDLERIAGQVGDAPYGVNLLVPSASAGLPGGGVIPEEQARFLRGVCDELDLSAERSAGGAHKVFGGAAMTTEHAMGLWDVCRAAGPRLVSVGLGTPPASLMEESRAMGSVRVALAGSLRQAERLRDAGFDCVVAQGGEAAGHTGTIGTFVLVPQVVEAVFPLPVLAAGGVVRGSQIAAAEALGASGVWIGSALLPTRESSLPPALKARLLGAASDDTLRTRALTGKPSRQLRNALLEAWERPGAPPPLPSPLQGELMEAAVVNGLATGDPRLMVTPAGQGIGLIEAEEGVGELVRRLVEEHGAAVDGWRHRSSDRADA